MTTVALGLLVTAVWLAEPAALQAKGPGDSVSAPAPPPAPVTAPAPAPAPLLALDFDRCPAVPRGEVQRVVGVELHRPAVLVGAQARVPGGAAPAATTTARVICDGLRADIE